MKEELFKVLDALYDFMNPSLRYADKEQWKNDTLQRVSNKSDEELKAWINTMWDIINYTDED